MIEPLLTRVVLESEYLKLEVENAKLREALRQLNDHFHASPTLQEIVRHALETSPHGG